ncbi:MAG: RNA 2',3'-cyclic phosphodiesterase [Streptosporangiaceae bacterium]|jgi:2'-5' RNA ligase
MRLFVAITPPAAALEELAVAVAPLRAAWPQLRWTDPAGWHVTLAFLGEVDEAAAARLAPRLDRAARRHPVLSLSLSGAGAFPGPARARVLWARVGGEVSGVAAIASSVAAAARRAGAAAPDERRRLRPHVTLARCGAPADVRSLLAALAAYSGTPWDAAEVQLIRSFLGPRPRYELLAAWPLRGARR